MSYPTLYFGVELEFCAAFLFPNDTIPDPTESRPSRFSPSDELIFEATEKLPGGPFTRNLIFEGKWELLVTPSQRWDIMDRTIRKSICEDLSAGGFPTSLQETLPDGDVSRWSLTIDESVQPPDSNSTPYKYNWSKLELVSPAYEFTVENVLAVEKVYDILSTNYLTNTNNTTGLHVHISFGLNKKWSFGSLRRAMMFFFCFHFQFDTIHPQHRQGDTNYTKSMRSHSQMSKEYFLSHGNYIPSIEGLLFLDQCEDIDTLIRAASDKCYENVERYMAYNMENIYRYMHPEEIGEPGNAKTTLEFRQHEGTVNSERVVQWVKLLCRTIQWLERVQPASFIELLNVAQYEKWNKTGDKAIDDENERKFGPVLAEGAFTIIDLLEHMELQESANYYRTRLYAVKGG